MEDDELEFQEIYDAFQPKIHRYLKHFGFSSDLWDGG